MGSTTAEEKGRIEVLRNHRLRPSRLRLPEQREQSDAALEKLKRPSYGEVSVFQLVLLKECTFEGKKARDFERRGT